ncbi:MAG TPA: Gfo/Idh/MocA family oxidoreductase [Chloroflexota bacterium]
MVGAGAFGRFCIEAYRESGDVQVLAVADPDSQALAQVDAPDARLAQDWRDLLDDSAIEVMHLATPPHLRGEIVFHALSAGKSVFFEKPLALSLAEADAMIEAVENRGVGLGVNYVMRHLPAYRILEQLASSGRIGQLRSISFQNFAQSLPSDHWFWDPRKSGGIFVEHGVHFFDAYGRIAGIPTHVSGSSPRREAVEATVVYDSGVVGRFYHEFAFPREIERAIGISFFERGWVEIEGWIPTRLGGAAMVSLDSLPTIAGDVPHPVLTRDGDVTRFQLDFPDRERSYRSAVVAGMRDMVRRHRDPAHHMTVSVEEARASLALALACQEATTRTTMLSP